MGLFDFLNDMGDDKSKYKKVEVNKDDQTLIEYLEILVNRGLMTEEFKSELCNLYFDRKIDRKLLYQNIEKSVDAHESIEYKLISVDDEKFKKRNHTKEYVGVIDRLTDDKTKLNSERGKISYEFANQILEHFRGRILNVKIMNSLCDSLDCDVKSIFNKDIITEGVIVSKK
jgi:hypothetical protein